MRIFEDIIDTADIQTDERSSSDIISKESDYQSELPLPEESGLHLLVCAQLAQDALTSKEDVQRLRTRLYDMFDSLKVIKDFSRITIKMHDPVDEPDIIENKNSYYSKVQFALSFYPLGITAVLNALSVLSYAMKTYPKQYMYYTDFYGIYGKEYKDGMFSNVLHTSFEIDELWSKYKRCILSQFELKYITILTQIVFGDISERDYTQIKKHTGNLTL